MALEAVMKDRNTDYGDPEDNFEDIAEFWSTYLDHSITSYDVAVMMILVKCSRMKTSPFAMDHWVDAAGYAACGCEAAHSYAKEMQYGDEIGPEWEGRYGGRQEDSIPEGSASEA